MHTVKTKPIAYRWALDAGGYPQPISEAQRGKQYFCPLCHGPMIARLGNSLQHHFGHEVEQGCPSEAVTRAGLSRWVALQLRQAMADKRPIWVNWLCRRCGNQHQSDLMLGVSEIVEGYSAQSHTADIALFGASADAANKLPGAVILIQDSLGPTKETIDYFATTSEFVLMLGASALPVGADVGALLGLAQVFSGPCPLIQSVPNLVQDPDKIITILRDSVSRWPGYFYAVLETVQGVRDLVRVGNAYLWLPPERWQQIVGGMRNPLAAGVSVTIQTWTHTDGGPIWLYFIAVRDSYAIGVRRYAPGDTPIPYVDGRFRYNKLQALDLARHLVRG